MSDSTVDWNSDPAGMMTFYQGQNYDLGQTIADLVDNGIDEGADAVEIVIYPGENQSELFIAIFDNGTGIHESIFDDIMKLGHSTKKDATKLGVFGIGLKLSSLAQADEVTIQSRTNGEVPAIRRISAPFIIEKNVNKLMKYPNTDKDGNDTFAFEFCHKKMMDEGWSTFVLLEGIHAADQFVAINENYKTSLGKELHRIIIHLGLTYHRILGKRDIVIEIGDGRGGKKKIEPLHPDMPKEDDIDFGTVKSGSQTIAYDFNDKSLNVKVEYVIIPHAKTRLHKKISEKINTGYKQAAAMQGLYIYRNDRLIQYGGWQRMIGGSSETIDPHHTLGKIFVDIPADHIKLFGLNPTKTGVSLPQEFLRRLLEDSNQKRKWGAIKGGAEMTFTQAYKHRYNNEGKGLEKRATQIEESKSNSTINNVPNATEDPKARVRNRKKKLKPMKIITKIMENGDDVVLSFSGSEEGKQNFLEFIKEWRTSE